jgi:hypothetical protein
MVAMVDKGAVIDMITSRTVAIRMGMTTMCGTIPGGAGRDSGR